MKPLSPRRKDSGVALLLGVDRFMSEMRSITNIIGNGVATPKAFPYHSGMRVLDLVVAAGGLSQFAAGNRAKVVRANPDGTTHEIKVRLADLMGRGAVTENILLQPGDILVVPESWF